MGDPTSLPTGEARDKTDTKPASPPGRLWAIGVLVLSAVVSMSMNTVHAFKATSLPEPLALMYGIAPVALAAMQSHSVALRALRKEKVGTFRKGLTFGLVLGGLGLSFLGIYDLLRHAVPDPIEATPIHEPAVFFSIVLDLMALAALHELLRESPSLVTAAQAVRADVPPMQEPQPPAGPPAEPTEVHAQPITTPPAPQPATVRLPALQPFVPFMSATQRSIALNGGSNGSVTLLERAPAPEPDTAREDTTEDRPRKARRSTEEECERARAMYRRSVEYGSPMTQTELGERFGYSRSWARDRIAEVEAEGQS
jgi:hypothetical protein